MANKYIFRGMLIPFIFLAVYIFSPLVSCAQPNNTNNNTSNTNEFMDLLANARRLSSERNWTAAVKAWEQVTEQNPVNGEYYANLGDAYYNNAQYAKAIEVYKKQMELQFGWLPSAAYNIACCYALDGQKEQALDWLDKSFKMGFRSYPHAQRDSDLQSLHGDPRFIKILALDDVSKMTREQGWQYDMEVLKKEVLRKAYFRRELSLDEFNKKYDQLYKSINKKTDVQMILGLMNLMKEVGDGHSAIFPPSRREFRMTLPLQFYSFKEGLYIVAADPKYKQLVGSKVVSFGNKTVEEVFSTFSQYLCRDNEMGVLENLQSVVRHTPALHALGFIPDPDKMELKLEDANGKQSVTTVLADTTQPRVDHKSVPAHWVKLYELSGKPVPLYLRNIKTHYWFEQLPASKTVYFQWNQVRNDKVPLTRFTDSLMTFINENDVDKLVIDLRWNNGGNTMLLPYFINAVIKNDKINKRGNLFVITGRRTFSAAQNLSTYLEKQTNAIFVGEPTGSNPNFVGEEDFLTLPYSKLAMNVSDLYWQSSWPWDKRTWIAPTIYAPPTFKDYSANVDGVLRAMGGLIDAKKGF